MNSVSNNFEMKDIISVWKAMYDKKRQSYPLFSTSLNDAIRHLQNMKDDNCCMLLEENFVHVSTEKSIVCITNKENLQFMMNCSELFADGTFYNTQYAPKHFSINFILSTVIKMDFMHRLFTFFCQIKPKKPTKTCGYFLWTCV
uniref:Uncharacterized protein n=1 Tax=Schizaphis graminum TaxID=13262 RepID=A0A2S2NIK8_SCHGA